MTQRGGGCVETLTLDGKAGTGLYRSTVSFLAQLQKWLCRDYLR